jgi:hypothetical protein
MALLNDILARYLGGQPESGQPAEDFQHVAQNVSPDVLGKGLSAALGSAQTPPAGQMVSQMFEASTPEQRAAMLNRLIAALGPAGSSIIVGMLGRGNAATGATRAVTPEQASQVSPQQVQDVVTRAQQHDPGILDSLGGFYAQHPGLVKTLGAAALAIALGRISQHLRGA